MRFVVQPLVVASAVMSGCALDVDVPLLPPPETWDPALNTHPRGSSLREALERTVGDGLPGVVLFVQTPEGVWNGAAGYAKLETQDPMVPTHRHCAASATKAYTAAATMLLVEDGLVDLDARISRYLPSETCTSIPNGMQATVRQLLGHTSGIPDFGDNMMYDLDSFNDPHGSVSPGQLLAYLRGQSSIFRPGDGFHYSNANYLLLALIMDRVTGDSHADVISRRLLEPLGLTATYYKNEPGYPEPPGLVNTYRDLAGNGRLMNVSDLTVKGLETSLGYAGLIATAADFAAFARALFEGKVVGVDSLEQMQQPQAGPWYGLGLGLKKTTWGLMVGHDGGDTGSLAEVQHFPGHDATVVLLANGGNSGVPEKLFDALWERALRVTLGAPKLGMPSG